MRVTVKTTGFKELEQSLMELPRATGKNVVRRTLRKAAEPIAADASTNAPRGRTGKLQDDIHVGTQLTRSQRKAKESGFEVHVGPSADPRGRFVEFGTAHQAPNPFLRRAWDANEANALSTIRTTLADEIKKAAARLARKQAKAAAR
jgi:HK97 gp10 family phage protein